LTWFYLHCAVAIVILIADARGTLEPTIKHWERKLGIPVQEEVEKIEDLEEENISLL
jgi:hypothetical protein